MINFIEEAERLIRINSESRIGNEEITSYLQNLMKTLGFKTSLQEVTHSLDGVSKRQFNLIGILGDPLVDRTTKKGLLLNTHLDTVSPGITKHWSETDFNPYNPVIKEGKIFGLGSADVKLDFLCKLKACEKYRDRRLKMPVYLIGTAGEEIGMVGAKFLIKSLAVNPKYVLVGEPTELAVVYGHKAYCVYKVSVGYNQREKDAKGFNTRIELKCFGKASHGSYPHMGENAIDKLLAVVKTVEESNFQIKFTRMIGGDLVNKVPDIAAIEFFIASSSFEDFRRFFRDTFGNDQQIQVEFGGLGESGMKFIPDNLLNSIDEVRGVFEHFQKDYLAVEDEGFNPTTSTVNFGRLVQRQDGVDLFFDIRLLPKINPEEFDSKLKSAIQAVNFKYSNLIMKVNRTRFNPSLNMKDDSEFVRTAKEVQDSIGITAGLQKKATSTEAAQYFQAGFDAVVFGPGKSVGNSHTPNEHNLVEHLDKAVHFYDRMIERFCL